MAELDEVIPLDACNSGRKASASVDVEQRWAEAGGVLPSGTDLCYVGHFL